MIRPVFLAVALATAPAAAQAATWTVNITGPIDLGTVISGTAGDTVFRLSGATGAVTVASGAGRRLSGGPARIEVTVSCRPSRGNDTECQTRPVPMRIGIIGLTTGRARSFAAFNVFLSSSDLAGPITGGNPLMFTLAPIGTNVTKSFFVGADFPVAGDDSGLPTGPGENAFYVYALDPNGQTSAGDTDKGKVNVLRSLSIGSTAPLSFGRIQLPTRGSSTINLDPATGSRTVTGDAVPYATPAPSRAAFTIQGEGGQQVSITVPSTIQLTGPASLAVTINDTAPPAATLSGALGAAGSYSFHVGGSFTLTPATPPGDYTGVLTVSTDYN